MHRRESIRSILLGALSAPFGTKADWLDWDVLAPLQAAWRKVYPIEKLTPKQKIGGLIRCNDPSFFESDHGRLITRHGRFKRHRTFLFPQ